MLPAQRGMESPERPQWQRHRLSAHGTLVVSIHSAADLGASEWIGSAAPNAYAIVTLAGKSFQTPVVPASKDPTWESTFAFSCRLGDIVDTFLTVQLHSESAAK